VFRVSFIARHSDGDSHGGSEGVPLRFMVLPSLQRIPPFGAIFIQDFSFRDYEV
jgi:hypothetical protein